MSRRKAVTTGAFVAALLCLTAPAYACRLYSPQSSALTSHEIVVLVSIDTAARRDEPGWNSRSLTAHAIRVIAGSNGAEDYSFGATLSSSGCGQTPLPTKGEEWVVYLDKADPQVRLALPLSFAKRLDPRLASVG